MAGHSYRIELLEDGAWSVATLDADEPPRRFATQDEALLWCARQCPLAIQMPDHRFAPTAQGAGVEVSTDHSFSGA
ncbi:MAG TPA: hypothetical protein VEL07_09180 [Planctomycetota bacterium]|nr:hypothetical protein [Planctomycetota bacterium]